MPVRLKLVLVAAVAVFSFAAFASSASADVYCVQVTTCSYNGESGTELAGFDEIPFWEFTEGSGPHALVLGDDGGPISGTVGFVSDTERLDVVAEPGSSPVVQHTGGSISTMSISAPGCVIHGIDVEVPDLVNGRALNTNCDLSNVDVFGTTTAIETTGVYATGDSDMAITNLDVNWDAGSQGTAVRVTSTGEVEILDATISGSILTGVDAASSAGSGLELRRSRITVVGSAIVNSGYGGYFHAFDVLARATAQPQGNGVVSLGNGSAFTGNHLTIIGTGDQFRFGILARANSGVLNADVSNSIIASTGPAFGLAVFGEETGTTPFAGVQTHHSMIANAFGLHVDLNTPVLAGVGEPKFVGPADFRLKPNQQAIDASVGAESDTVDANGEGRPVDGDASGSAVSDLGAFEYQRRAPDTDVLGPTSLAAGQQGEFDARGTFDADGDDMTYEWDFGDGSPTDSSGLVVHHSYSPGKFILKFTATDESGESDTTTLDVTVPAPFVPPVIVPELPKDTTAPNVSIGKVTPNKKRTSLSTKVTCPASEATCKFVLSYSARTGKTGKAKRMANDATATVAGGRTATLKLKLNPAALKLIKSKGKLKGTIKLATTDGSNNAATKTVLYSAKAGKTGSAK